MTGAAGEPRTVHPAPPVRGRFTVPGSKSLTNRALVLAAMAEGRSTLRGALRSADTDALAGALRALGARIERRGDAELVVDGVGGEFPAGPDVSVNLGDGGTPARFMMAVAAFARRRVTVDGSARMRERPVADLVGMLRTLGARVEWVEEEGRLPVAVDGRAGPPAGGTVEVESVASSQFISAVLLVGPWMQAGVDMLFRVPPVSGSYVGLTLGELQGWGLRGEASRDAGGLLRSVRVPRQTVSGRERWIEPDASSALYLVGAAALVPGSALEIPGVSEVSEQPDSRAIRLLGAMGADLRFGPGSAAVGCRARADDAAPPLDGRHADLADCPDGALMAIAAAAVAAGGSRFEGLGTLRVKESDRLAAMAEGLGRIGARARIGGDWIEVDPVPAGHRVAATIDPHRDHRVAMSFAVLGLRTGGIRIEDPGCVAKSFPGFWQLFERLERGGA